MDIRVGKDYGEEGIHKLLDEWTSAEGALWKFVQHSPLIDDTSTDWDNPWWRSMETVFKSRY